jgi:predicted GNAT family acetyltransferase
VGRRGSFCYRRAFAAVDADPAQLLLAVTHGPDVVGTAQLTEIPGLSRGGTTRLQVEAVRVRADLRGQGVGAALLTWAVEEARRRGCGLVQLTTDTRRPEAHRGWGSPPRTSASSGSSDRPQRTRSATTWAYTCPCTARTAARCSARHPRSAGRGAGRVSAAATAASRDTGSRPRSSSLS